MKERDIYIDSRKKEIELLQSLISQSRDGFNDYKAQRDKLQDERKYDFVTLWSIMKRQKLFCNFLLGIVDAKHVNMIKSVSLFRSLWGKESELSAEIDKLKTEVVKAEKSLDHATPGVSDSSLTCIRF